MPIYMYMYLKHNCPATDYPYSIHCKLFKLWWNIIIFYSNLHLYQPFTRNWGGGYRIRITVVMQYDFEICFEHILLISQKDKEKFLQLTSSFWIFLFSLNLLLTMKDKAFSSFLSELESNQLILDERQISDYYLNLWIYLVHIWES